MLLPRPDNSSGLLQLEQMLESQTKLSEECKESERVWFCSPIAWDMSRYEQMLVCVLQPKG